MSFMLNLMMGGGDYLTVLKREITDVNVNTRCGSYNGTLLHNFCQDGSVDCIEFLVKNGANLNAEDMCGRVQNILVFSNTQF